MKELTLEQLHKRLINIAIVFHQICVENNIPYYMLGGSMLGAIRHRGFVPWDDDMDFGIPREHFDKFLSIASQQIPKNYSILTHNNSESMILGFAKITDNETIIKEHFTTKNERCLGVNIDIFPLDHSNGNRGFFSKNYIIRSFIKFQKLIYVDSSNRPFFKRYVARFVQFLLPISKNRIPNFLAKIFNRRCSKNQEYSYLSNFYGAWGLRETIAKRIMGKSTLYPFENIELFGAERYDEYLKGLYGDYMKLPPEEKRHLHQTNAYVLD